MKIGDRSRIDDDGRRPKPPVLRPGTIVRIPGLDVLYVVNKGLETDGPTAMLTFTTIDGLDWYEERPKPAS